MRLPNSSIVLLVLAAWPLRAAAEQLKEMDALQVQEVGEKILAKANQIDSPQVKMNVNLAQAVGMTIGRDGLLLVPQKGLAEESEAANREVKSEQGAPLAYLFLSENFEPVVRDGPEEAVKWRTLAIADDQGARREVKCLLLAVRRVGEDDWRLYAYGAGRQPLVDAPFGAASSAKQSSGPIALEIVDTVGGEGTLAVIVFGKYQAGVRIRYTGK